MSFPIARIRITAIFLALAAFVLNTAAAPNTPNGITPRLQSLLENDPGPHRVWVFFTDKGFQTPDERERAIAEIASTYNGRATERRRLRARTSFGFQDLPVHEPYVEAIAATGAHVRITSKWLNAASAVATGEQIEAIAALPFVAKVQQVARARNPEPLNVGPDAALPSGSTKDPLDYGLSTEQLTQINLIALHEDGYTGAGVVIGILDTGFRRDHVAFNQPGHEVEVIAEYDFVDDDTDASNEPGDPSSQHNHGTMILGTIGAYYPGQLVGGAYDASFILCKTEDTTAEYQGEEDNFVAGLEFIEAQGGDVVTSSLGYIDWYTQSDLDGETAVTTIAVNTATSLGLHCVNAAGNDYHDSNPATSSLIAPSDAFQVITCGAVTSSGSITSFSSDGPTADGRVKPELLALGYSTDTVSPSSTTAYTIADGTSLSTPLVGAAVACLTQARPGWSVDTMRQQLFLNADYDPGGLGFDPLYVRGYGILDAAGTHRNASGIFVSPGADLITEGASGGPFDPASAAYTVENNGDTPLDYLVFADQPWLDIANGAGTLPAGGSVDVTVALNYQAEALGQGHYEATVDFVNATDHEGDTRRMVVLDVARTIISVSPEKSFDTTGPVGGPFTAVMRYTVTSERPTPVEVELSADQPWLTLGVGTGGLSFTLDGTGDSREVLVGLSGLATILEAGNYTAGISFANMTSGEGDAVRAVNLTVGGPQPHLLESLDTDPGWTVTGGWEFGQPTGQGSHNLDPSSGYTGDNVYGYNLDGDYTDYMPEFALTSTSFDCSAVESVRVRFQRWLGVESATWDAALFLASIDGSNWTTVWDNIYVSGAVSDASWNLVEYDISAIADHQPAVYLRWTMGPTDSSVTYPGWNIDDVEILGITQERTVSLVMDDQALLWTPRDEVMDYDVVMGSLEELRSSGGDFSLATVECSADGTLATSLSHGGSPSPGQGQWWLVRGNTAGGPATYDAIGDSQVGLRDGEIAASGAACP